MADTTTTRAQRPPIAAPAAHRPFPHMVEAGTAATPNPGASEGERLQEAAFNRIRALLSDGEQDTTPDAQRVQADLHRLWLRLDEVQAVAACLASIGATEDIAQAYAYDAGAAPHDAKGQCVDALARVLGVLAREAKGAHASIEKRAGCNP